MSRGAKVTRYSGLGELVLSKKWNVNYVFIRSILEVDAQLQAEMLIFIVCMVNAIKINDWFVARI